MVETLTHVYTSAAEMITLLGEDSKDERYDDLTGTNLTTAETEVFAYGTDIVNQYCAEFYDEVDMVNNLWVRRRATIISVWYLSQREGEAPLYVDLYDRTIAELEKIHKQELRIPRLAFRDDFGPGMTNYTIDDRFSHRKIRVDPSTSVGKRYGDQDLLDVDYNE